MMANVNHMKEVPTSRPPVTTRKETFMCVHVQSVVKTQFVVPRDDCDPKFHEYKLQTPTTELYVNKVSIQFVQN